MLHRTFVPRLLLFCFCSALLAGCSSPPSKVETKPVTAVAGVAGNAQERAAAYAERLRLGLGSPYRLTEIALNDERLGAARIPVARALLAQIEHGRLYEIDARALRAAGIEVPSAIAQLELIEQAIESARDPRVGELAVDLAYELAVAEKTVSAVLVSRAVRVAALVRDRQLARSDVQRLRSMARHSHVPAEDLIADWRAQRRFAVEQPTLAPLDAAAQDEAARLALLLVGGIRSAMAPVSSVMQRTLASSPAMLDPNAARTLLRDSSARSPQSALVISLRALRAAATGEWPRLAAHNWEQFFQTAIDEERLVAALAIARQDSADDVVATSIALDAAIALRPFAQEPAAADSVSIQDLARRFGVRVRFAERIDAAQRTAALQELASALRDLRSVARSIDFTGLTIAVAPIAADAAHLAFHDPLRRIIRFDPATMAGTIAHELAHDLDWQLAARRYKTRSNYATDFATKNGRALAYVVEGLVEEAAPMPQFGSTEASARRPAEMFARRFEWYAATALALNGRSSGHLSSVQNDWITGYGSAVRPDPAPTAARSFAALLAEATNLDRGDRAAVERVVMESAPVAARVLNRVATARDLAHARSQSLAEVRAWECTNPWHSVQSDGTGIRWFVDALDAALSRAASTSPYNQQSDDILTIAAVRATDPGNQLGIRLGGCNPLGGVFLAQSMR